MRAWLLLLLPVVGVGCAPPAAPRAAATAPRAAAPVLLWHARVDARLGLEERVCWDGFVPGAIEPELAAARPWGRLAADDAGAARGCATVRLDVAGLAAALADTATLASAGDGTVVGSFDAWLWRPRSWPAGLVGELTLDLAPEVRAVLPNERTAAGRYLVPASTFGFATRMTLGRVDPITVRVGDTELVIARLGAAPAVTDEGLRRWLGDAGRAVARVDAGHFPTASAQVLLLPAHGDDPVGFGMAFRGGGPNVLLHVDDAATEATLRPDWVAVHELAHLWLPPIRREDAWLSEGLASYWQCVLRARSGLVDERAAWAELLAGFARGRAAARGPLRDAGGQRFMQIYWGGAAIALALDVELRRSGGSLDEAVAHYRHAHPEGGPGRADLDELRALPLLRDLVGPALAATVERWLERPFLETATLLADLGVRGVGGALRLEDDAPLAALRRAITRPAP